ncbi:Serine/threonine-protein kinase PK-1 [Leucobacter soli]|uniref:non-specific serine/threonine protein kinase n=1 Tax=Leucobacter soli TaxID=2812850 RepID=A0A916JTI3_9MICO|nr:Serine/threonine-protein kinase PK-1 [Leucobacter soli]
MYLGNDLRLQRRVAIKVMHHHLVEDDSFTRRFEQEARSAAMLGNANVVGVFDQGVDGGLPYLVMEYLPGITLRELLKQQKRLTADQALEIGEAVLAGLAAAHAAGLVHRDLKPENVLLADDGRIKIGDFGLARAVSANTTTGQALLGTIAYLSPELVTRGVADARSDVYAFGIMLFEMLTGQQPFKGEQAMQIAYQHAHSEVPAPSTLNPEVGPEFDRLVQWCTQREPDARPRDAGEVIDSLRAIRDGEPLGSTRVLPFTLPIGTATPATAVLSGGERQAVAAGAPARAETAPVAAPATAVERAGAAGLRRARRGRWMAALLIVLVAAAAGSGWWWGQGPGSLVTVPGLVGQDPAAATAALEELTLRASQDECSSLDVEAGLVVSSDPSAGTRVERESRVSLCVSTGPEMLPVPTLVGLSLDAAQEEIEEAGFVFGEVLDRVFEKGERDTVYLAVDEQGDGLGDAYPEQGRIDLLISAGPLPSVTGLSVDDATSTLEDLGLLVKKSMNERAYNDEIAEGDVIGLITSGKTVKVGSKVGLNVSRGPQLFEVPDVSGMDLQEAMDELQSLGFSPTTGVPDSLRRFAKATGTDPAAGEMLPKGATIRVRATISLD